ncbi:MAG TPA: hypothetical protein VEI97_07505 [bacterium]|nr:hypothetical protein [bacterium]
MNKPKFPHAWRVTLSVLEAGSGPEYTAEEFAAVTREAFDAYVWGEVDEIDREFYLDTIGG